MTLTATRLLAELDQPSLLNLLSTSGLDLHSGPLRVRLHSSLPDMAQTLLKLYAGHRVSAASGFADFHVRIKAAGGLRRFYRPQAQFLFDGEMPFKPLPRNQAFALFEWGLNWCIATHCHQYLVVHAAVIARDGLAAILPAPPGSGKSTLCAALINRGWRLCSDELALIMPDSGHIQALARPVNLKNSSIALMRDFAPAAQFGPLVHDTLKGTVAHMAPPADSVRDVMLPVSPRWIVFPHWQAQGQMQLQARPRNEAFIELADNAFNYSVLGEGGFEVLRQVVDQCECLSFSYSRLDDAVATFERLAEQAT